MHNEPITHERIKLLVNYDPTTGIFTWNLPRRKCTPGKQTGCKMRNGYIAIRLDNVLYTAHRLAWMYVTGNWPADQLDHINGDRSDNRIVNLRESTNAENAQNRKRKDNKSGFTGVRRENKKWLAEIKLDYAHIRLGLFETPEEAHQAYLKAKHKLHPFSRN